MTSKEKKTVLIAIPILLRGGTEIQTLALVRVLHERGYRVAVCCYYEYDEEMVSEFQREGAEVELLKLERSEGSMSLSAMSALMVALYRFFRRVKPDVIHVQYVAPGLVPILAATLAGGKRIFATIHYPNHSFGKKEKLFVLLASRLCTMFFCNSLATERSWFGNGRIGEESDRVSSSRHRTIYNCVDARTIEEGSRTASKASIKKELGLGDQPVVGVVARLRSEKGQLFLLNAMSKVVHSVPGTMLIVVGDGPDGVLLRSFAAQLHIADHVIWLGSTSHRESLQWYGGMDVVAVPSRFEGFGLSAAEAMAAGVPVVASDVGGLPEVVKDGETGFLVPFGDVDKLAHSLVELLKNSSKAQEFGRRGKERVNLLFSYERFQKSILTAYEDS